MRQERKHRKTSRFGGMRVRGTGWGMLGLKQGERQLFSQDVLTPKAQRGGPLSAFTLKALRVSRVGEGEQCPRAAMSKGY